MATSKALKGHPADGKANGADEASRRLRDGSTTSSHDRSSLIAWFSGLLVDTLPGLHSTPRSRSPAWPYRHREQTGC